MTIENDDVLLVNRGSDSYQIKYEKIKQDIEDNTNQFPEAPENGKQYGRQNADWTEIVHTTPYTDADVDDHLNKNLAEGGQILSWDGTDYKWIQDQTGGGDLTTYQYPGGVTRSVQSRLEDYVSFKDFGAKGGDGTMNAPDDSDAIEAALNSGRPVDGGGLTYRVSRNIKTDTSYAFKGLRNCTLTRPDMGSSADGCILKIGSIGQQSTQTDWFIDNVIFNWGDSEERVSTGVSSSIYKYKSLWIEVSTEFKVTNCTFTGNGAGTHLYINTCGLFTVDSCRAYETTAKDLTWNNDILQGIGVSRSGDFTISNCDAFSLKCQTQGMSSNQPHNSRGFAFGQCDHFSVVGCHSTLVGQGFDITGSAENSSGRIATNTNFIVSSCTASRCGTVGFKAANAPKMGMFSDCIAEEIGYHAFTCSAGTNPGDPELTDARYITFNNCKAIDTGTDVANLGKPSTDIFAFRVFGGATKLELPQRVDFNNCVVIQEQGTIQAGWKSSQKIVDISSQDSTWSYPPSGSVCNNCQIYEKQYGQVRTKYDGSIGPVYVQLREATWQHGGDNSFQDLVWLQGSEGGWDPQNMNSNSDERQRIYIKESGIYTVQAAAGMESDGNAQDLLIEIVHTGKNGNTIRRAIESSRRSASGNSPTVANISWTGVQQADSYLRIRVAMNGGYSTLASDKCYVTVTKVA